MIFDVAGPQERGRWTGLLQTWFFFGAASTALLSGFLTDQLGYGMALWLGAALTTAGGLVALFLLPETRPPAHGGAATAEAASSEPMPASRGGLWAAHALYGVGRFIGSGVLSAVTGLVVQAQMQPAAVLVGGVATLTGLLSARRTLCSMAAAPVAGTLSDRLAGRWRVTGWATCAGVAGFLLMVWGASGAVAGVLVASAATGGMESLATALTGDLAGPRQRGRAIGLLHTAGDLGSAVGPAAAFALLPWLDLRGVYLACAGIMAVSLAPAMYFGVRERRVRHPSGSPPASS